MRLQTARKRVHRRGQARRLGLPILLSLCWLWQGCSTSTTSARRGDGGGSVPVTVKGVVQKDVPVDLHVVGNVEAYLTVAVKAQVSGELTKVSFQEGDYVRKGDLLFTIDPRLIQAQLTQMEAVYARDVAQEKYAQAQTARYTQLLERGLVSKEQAEQFRTSAEAASATVRADEASLRSGRAAVAAGKAAV